MIAKAKSHSDAFLELDASDFKILLLLARRSAEFKKLDLADQKVFVWLLSHSHLRLQSWIDYLVEDYSDRGTCKINGTSLLEDVQGLVNER